MINVLFKTTLFCFFTLLFLTSSVRYSSAEIKVGVLAKRGPSRAMAQWAQTGNYLTDVLGEQVVIIPIKFTLIESMVKTGRIDFLFANSAFFVEMEKKYQARAITTVINSLDNKPLDKFGGVIFTRKGSGIKKLEDIRGKRFMTVKFSSFGGGQMAWRLLLKNNIDPQKETAAFLEAGTHDLVVRAVESGRVDVGTVRTDTLERMQSEGKIQINEFHIIHPIADDFPFVRSTRLYPEWPMAAMAHTTTELSDRVAAALQKIQPDSPAARAASIMGWTAPSDYSSVRDCLETIKYSIFVP
ncbi:ABC-type phosphate/phosphonate transport system, periplasmic component [Desulfocapsa sulfexigens DSM 10523]|uniref:ABC-type phosphate/phosphonate transport system, periplasmic component n=1 Tax=Desulfocapsa sulfexigens (strain DSM 10523 / SB164P1) TaxID=1167006 RepID=M1P9D5_DESSD|nr:phosphate/phosphite/phosphonate ABC transporter substrate-binding protein [Desulfocapsa sulfexigens]AGF80058.1 ABC-type phosphate/phosphonate transport system, periplasmic component [Desulfocapsa sulfexigens DSM 10523]